MGSVAKKILVSAPCSGVFRKGSHEKKDKYPPLFAPNFVRTTPGCKAKEAMLRK